MESCIDVRLNDGQTDRLTDWMNEWMCVSVYDRDTQPLGGATCTRFLLQLEEPQSFSFHLPISWEPTTQLLPKSWQTQSTAKLYEWSPLLLDLTGVCSHAAGMNTHITPLDLWIHIVQNNMHQYQHMHTHTPMHTNITDMVVPACLACSIKHVSACLH